MSKIMLREFYVNHNLRIRFNEGENYIIGANSSGKTTLFNLIQYIFGVKRIPPKQLASSFKIGDQPYLVCQFGNKLYKISRKLGTSEVTFEGDINRIVNAHSPELNDIYTELLKISFDSGINTQSSIEILKMSFLSELGTVQSYLYNGNNYSKILGLNDEFLLLIKKDIENLKGELATEKQTLEILDNYKTSVKRTLLSRQATLGKSHEEIIRILDDEFSKINASFSYKRDLLQRSEKMYKKELLNDYQISLYNEVSKLQAYFNKTINQISPGNRSLDELDLISIIKKGGINNLYGSDRLAVLFALNITFCRNNVHNGLGLLITDSLLLRNDTIITKNVRNKIKEVTKLKELQYIEFSNDSIYIPKSSVIFDLSKLGGNLFE